MESVNEKLKLTMIKQYAAISRTSEENLKKLIKTSEWWARERYRIDVQQKATLIGLTFLIFSMVLIVFLKMDENFESATLPVLSSMLLVFSAVLTIWIYRKVSEKNRLFSLMWLVFER
jgi:hypothetical protein